VNKSQLVDALAQHFEGNKKQAQRALESVLDTITREVARGEKVAITGFGAFEKQIKEARWVRNPRTGERIKAKKTAVPRFRPGAELKNVVSGAKKLPRIAVAKASSATKSAPGTTAKKSTPAKKTASKTSTPAKKTAAKKTAATKTAAKKTTTAKKTTAKRTTAKKS
jgi:DNA-binding protein HU-beta